MAASNTQDCFTETVGLKVAGVLFGAMPPQRHDIARSTKTLIFDDGTGLTFASNGSFWRESAGDVARAVAAKKTELERTHEELSGVLALAGAGAADGSE